MPLVMREIDAGKERTARRAVDDKLPCPVTAAVIDKSNPAACTDVPVFDEAGHLLQELLCRIIEDILLVVAWDNEIKNRLPHHLCVL